MMITNIKEEKYLSSYLMVLFVAAGYATFKLPMSFANLELSVAYIVRIIDIINATNTVEWCMKNARELKLRSVAIEKLKRPPLLRVLVGRKPKMHFDGALRASYSHDPLEHHPIALYGAFLWHLHPWPSQR